MIENTELAELRQLILHQQTEMKALQAKLAHQETEIASHKQELNALKVSQTPPLANFEQALARPTNRRKLLKNLGVAAAGMAAIMTTGTTLAADNKTQGVGTSATDGPLLIGVATNSPTSSDIIATTGLINPSSSVLSNNLFVANNYTLAAANLLQLTASLRVGVSGLASGPDTVSNPKVGVFGAADGRAANGTDQGVLGYGVWGRATDNGYGGRFQGQTAALLLANNTRGTGAPTTGTHLAGELYLDANEALFYCIGGGVPGTWRKLAGTGTAGTLHLLPTPDRFVDTRPTSQIGTVTGPLQSNSVTTITLTNTPGRDQQRIPAAALAVVGNVTVVTPTANGFIKVLPGGTAANVGTSTVNFNGGFNTANSFVCALNATGQVTVVVAPNVSVQLLIDIAGYYL